MLPIMEMISTSSLAAAIVPQIQDEHVFPVLLKSNRPGAQPLKLQLHRVVSSLRVSALSLKFRLCCVVQSLLAHCSKTLSSVVLCRGAMLRAAPQFEGTVALFQPAQSSTPQKVSPRNLRNDSQVRSRTPRHREKQGSK